MLLAGCLTLQRQGWLTGADVPVTTGRVMAVELVQRLRVRGSTGWDYAAAWARLSSVPDTRTSRLVDDPPRDAPWPQREEVTSGMLKMASESAYVQSHGSLLPRSQWHAEGFLVHVEVDEVL